MKSGMIYKTLGTLALTTLSLAVGNASADGRFCLTLGAPQMQHSTSYGDFDRRGWPERIDARQARLWERIQQGLRSGQLTPHEAHRLMHEQRHIERLQHRYLADGHLSGYEWHRLDEALDEAEWHIRAERRDRQRY